MSDDDDEVARARHAVRVEGGRLGMAIRHSRPDFDADATAAVARSGQFAKFCERVDPDGKLDETTLRRMHGAELNARMARGRLGQAQKRLKRVKTEKAA